MHRASLPLSPLFVVASLILTGCSDLPPGETGVFGNNGAVAGGNMARSLTVASAGSQATGSSGGTLATATINVIATHQASERQRRIAQTRARAAVAKIKIRHEREHTAAVAKAKKKTASAHQPEPTQTKSGKPEPKIAANIRDVDVTVPKKKLPRYIAVETVKDERTAPQAAKALMIFDTQTQEIVGNNVYDVRSTPQIGATARFETFTAEYVGSGE